MTAFQEYLKFIEQGIYYCTKHDKYFHTRQKMDRHLQQKHGENVGRLNPDYEQKESEK